MGFEYFEGPLRKLDTTKLTHWVMIYTGIHLNWGILLSFYIFIKYLYCEDEGIFQQLIH